MTLLSSSRSTTIATTTSCSIPPRTGSESPLTSRLLIAVPKKGRLHSHVMALLQGADIRFTRHARLDVALCTNLSMRVPMSPSNPSTNPIGDGDHSGREREVGVGIVFLPAADIGEFVGRGSVAVGITGEDVILESGLDIYPNPPASRDASKNQEGTGGGGGGDDDDGQKKKKKKKAGVVEMLKLDFGKCRLCVQVPQQSGIRDVSELIGKRIVTSFERVTKQYFSQLEQKQRQKRTDEGEEGLKTEVGYISGSVEAACTLGLADGIVDLVESGETMRAAGLTDIETILETQAILIANPHLPSHFQPLLDNIVARIRGVQVANQHVLIKYNTHRDGLKECTKITPGNRAPTVSPLEDEGWVGVEAMIGKKDAAVIMDRLVKAGATDILVFQINNCRA